MTDVDGAQSPCTLPFHIHYLTRPSQNPCSHPHFSVEETEAQRKGVTCPPSGDARTALDSSWEALGSNSCLPGNVKVNSSSGSLDPGPLSPGGKSEAPSASQPAPPHFSHRGAAAPQPWLGLAVGRLVHVPFLDPRARQKGAPGSVAPPGTEGEVYSLVQSTSI